ncbi:MAG: GNAT family N-acetyltransferase [Bacteroidota bacterium]
MNLPATSKIVPFQSADLQELAELSRKTFQQGFGHWYDPSILASYLQDSFSIPQLQTEIQDSSSRFWGVKVDSGWIAYAKLRSSKIPPELAGQKVIELQRMYVLQAYWGKGVAHILMNHCIEFAQKESFSHLWLGVWEDNDRAIRFYEKYGFSQIGKQQFKVSASLIEEDWVMAKQLSNT